MKFKPANRSRAAERPLESTLQRARREVLQPKGWTPASRAQAAFTLAEVLAALLFMAIVIPVAVQGLPIASRAGSVAERKAVGARLAESKLNELVVTHQWQSTAQKGT